MVEMKNIRGRRGVYLTRDIEVGRVIMDITPDGMNNVTTRFQNKYTIRAWHDKTCKQYHILSDIGQYMNHSCNPSAVFRDFKLIAIENMRKGSEVTFDYRDTERRITSPFDCECGDKRCVKRIE